MSCPPGSLARPAFVLGYGNTLRRDDGFGPRVAALVASQHLSGVHAFPLSHLTLGLAEALTEARLLIFVDARAPQPHDDGSLCLSRLLPVPDASETKQNETPIVSHYTAPQSLLQTICDLYNYQPPAYALSIAADDVSLGASLSPRLHAALPTAVQLIKQLLDKY